jgi:hypothetical protein
MISGVLDLILIGVAIVAVVLFVAPFWSNKH